MDNDAWDSPEGWQLLTAKFFAFKGKVYEIRKCDDNQWRDEFGCIYALADFENMVDLKNVCGVGIFSLPEGHPANEICAIHDFKYSSTTYQLYHTRREADEELERDLNKIGYPIFGRIARFVSRIFGKRFWENDKTR